MSKDTIYRQDAIKALDNAWINGTSLLDANEAIKQLHALPSSDRSQEWIPCSERLPEEDGRYFVTRYDYVTESSFVDILWYEKHTWWNRHIVGDFAVKAWMPLPKPWKGADETYGV